MPRRTMINYQPYRGQNRRRYRKRRRQQCSLAQGVEQIFNGVINGSFFGLNSGGNSGRSLPLFTWGHEDEEFDEVEGIGNETWLLEAASSQEVGGWEVEGRDDDHDCKIHVDGDFLFMAFGALGNSSNYFLK